MYNGGLITFKLHEKNKLISKSLLDIDIEIDDTGFLVKTKTGNILGHIERVVGIDFIEMMKIFNYEYIESE